MKVTNSQKEEKIIGKIEEKKAFSTDVIRRVLAAKDEKNISDEAYNNLKLVGGVSLPPLSQLISERNIQNGLIEIHDIPEVIHIHCTGFHFLSVSGYF